MRDAVRRLLTAAGVGLVVGGCCAAETAVLIGDRYIKFGSPWDAVWQGWPPRDHFILGAILTGTGGFLLLVAAMLGRRRRRLWAVVAVAFAAFGPAVAAPFVHWGATRPPTQTRDLIPDRDAAVAIVTSYINHQKVESITPAFRARREANRTHVSYHIPGPTPVTTVIRGDDREVVVITQVPADARTTKSGTTTGGSLAQVTFEPPITVGVRVRLVRTPDGRWLVDDAVWAEQGRPWGTPFLQR